jgi:hypothetical protein
LTPPTQAFDTPKNSFYLSSMPLTPVESRLSTALSAYLEAVSQGRAGSSHPAWTDKLKSVSQSLDSLCSELSSQVDPRLAHFLESKSYRKAYEYLSALASSGLANPAAPRQSCSK